MPFVKLFGHGVIVPWYYGYVKQSLHFHGYVMAIVPFHLLLRAWGLIKLAWLYFQWYGRREDVFNGEQALARAYEDGVERGRAYGLCEADIQYRPLVVELGDLKRKLLDAERTLKALQNLSNAVK